MIEIDFVRKIKGEESKVKPAKSLIPLTIEDKRALPFVPSRI